MIELIEALNGRLIGSKTWNRNVKMVGAFWTVRDSARTVWASWVLIYALNHVLMCMRPEMAMDFRFTKWNRCWVIFRKQ